MGGRLDAVNVVDPDVAVVASIGLDHQEYLGDTLEAIAREKAGIFRRASTAVIGGREPSRFSKGQRAAVAAPSEAPRDRIQLRARRQRLALSRHALGLAAAAGAGAPGRHAIRQCGGGARCVGGNQPAASDFPAAAIAQRTDRGALGRRDFK